MELKKDVFTNLKEINLDNFLTIDGSQENLKFSKLIISSKNSNRRVEEKSEVKLLLRKYLCLKDDLSLRIFNKDYKNITKRNIDKMTIEEGVIRKCLLELYDKQIAIFRVHKDFDLHQFKRAKVELKIDDMNVYEDYMYYHMLVESVVYPQPNEPKSIHSYDRYIKKFQDEIRYFISIENYTDAISWSNSIIQKFFNMSKELKKQMTEEIKKKLSPEMKSVYLNKTLALLKKPGKDTNKDYEETIKTTKEYFSFFPEKDEKFLKISKRLAKTYLFMKDIENAERVIEEIEKIQKDEDIKVLSNELQMTKTQIQNKKKPNFLRALKLDSKYLEDESYIWQEAVTEVDLSSNYELAVLNILN
jgi:hypothetical protein